jgi:hypothetical protein
MAAPALTARITPTGFKLLDGYQALIAWSSEPGLDVWEIEVQPPGIDGDEQINTTTMHNEDYRTFSPRSLKTLTPHQVVVAYDPSSWENLNGLINFNDAITVIYSDGSTLSFWGYLKSVEFQPMVEGEMPRATLTIVPTNWDDDNCVEAAPVMVSNGSC